MNRRNKADYQQLTHQIGSQILPTVEAALVDIEDIVQDVELSASVIRQLSGAQREASKACKSLNLAIVACQLEIEGALMKTSMKQTEKLPKN